MTEEEFSALLEELPPPRRLWILVAVARLMGHTSTRMVELVYGHLSSKEYRAAVAVLPRLGTAPTPAPSPATS